MDILGAVATVGSDLNGLFGILLLIGLATGTLTGLTGASGMSILISSLLLAGIDIRQVIGLTFVVTLVNAVFSLHAYLKHHHLDFRSGALVGIPAVAAVIPGCAFSYKITSGALTGMMIACLFLIGSKFFIFSEDRGSTEGNAAVRPHFVPLILMGCCAGFVIGIMGGGGALFIAAGLILLFRMETKTAIGTSILIMGMAALPGVISHWYRGTIKLSYAAVILAASIPAAWTAGWFANRIPSHVVKRILGAYLLGISVVLLYRTYF